MTEKTESIFSELPEDATQDDIIARLKQAAAEDDEPLDPTNLVSGPPKEDEEEQQIVPLTEGRHVRISGTVTDGKSEGSPVTLTGRIRGVAPVRTPFGIVGYDYIVELDNPSELPTDGGEAYPYTCITIDLKACQPIDEEDDG